MAVGEHAELGGYLHAFQRDVLGPKIAVADEGSGGGEGVGSAAAMEAMPSSGSITSPVPVSTSV